MIDIEDLVFPITEHKVILQSAESTSIDNYVIVYASFQEYRGYLCNRYCDHTSNSLLNGTTEWQFLQDRNNKEYFCFVTKMGISCILRCQTNY